MAKKKSSYLCQNCEAPITPKEYRDTKAKEGTALCKYCVKFVKGRIVQGALEERKVDG